MTGSPRPTTGRRQSPGPPLALLALAAAGCAGGPAGVDVVRLDRGAYPAIDGDLERVLIVVAHPDDELVAAGLTYLHGARRGGVVDVLTITDGQGGFKYASYLEARTGLALTDEEVGRRLLPDLRREEQRRGLELLGARRLVRLEETDHRYSRDRMEVLRPDAGVWDLARIRRTLDAMIAEERYDLVVTLSPTRETHGHHQAAAILAVEAVGRAPAGAQPVALCCQVEVADGGGVGRPPEVLEDALIAALRAEAGPFTVDRTAGFGHAGRMNLKSIAAVAVAQHLSQGTMLGYIGRGDLEEYWIFEVSPDDAAARCERFFGALREGPRFPERTYGASAGANAR